MICRRIACLREWSTGGGGRRLYTLRSTCGYFCHANPADYCITLPNRHFSGDHEFVCAADYVAARLLTDTRSEPVFAVRTHSETAILLFSINPTHRPHDSSLSVIVQELGLISMSETSGRRQMDIAMSPFEAARALIVDDEGQIYEWRGINKYGQKKPDL